ncbi:prepilin-type N-terminal cleavage/methylation domain-containing protein [Alkalibacterium sp. 20]|uniref:type IV pilus modification PilV family protein n=1 Tax=Alkalibacterium sp. 20 TaxID=1798803 RepID=UPI0008FFEA6E|nr:prepilin-type N-terminal cleavage/methylation domain-containing protein [Alkalibacterium sp. 20]OJF90900.1 hypothetical protein AX762_03780 [Alkalibacterium sp. 20]
MKSKLFIKKLIKDDSGVTLVELLAAIAILSIVVTAFLAFFIQAANTNKQTNEVNEATFIAQGVMEEITYYSGEGYTVADTEAAVVSPQSGFVIKTEFNELTDSALYQVIVIVSEGVEDRAQMETRLSFEK